MVMQDTSKCWTKSDNEEETVSMQQELLPRRGRILEAILTGSAAFIFIQSRECLPLCSKDDRRSKAISCLDGRLKALLSGGNFELSHQYCFSLPTMHGSARVGQNSLASSLAHPES